MARELTDKEVDFVLRKFDKTEPNLQRKVVATTMLRCAVSEYLVETVREECKHVSDVSKIAEMIDRVRSLNG